MFYKKGVFLEISQSSQENTCARVSFLIKLQANFIKKETLAQIFSCEFWEISKYTFFTEHVWATTSIVIIWGNQVLAIWIEPYVDDLVSFFSEPGQLALVQWFSYCIFQSLGDN